MIEVSARTGEGIADWLAWLVARRPARRTISAASNR